MHIHLHIHKAKHSTWPCKLEMPPMLRHSAHSTGSETTRGGMARYTGRHNTYLYAAIIVARACASYASAMRWSFFAASVASLSRAFSCSAARVYATHSRCVCCSSCHRYGAQEVHIQVGRTHLHTRIRTYAHPHTRTHAHTHTRTDRHTHTRTHAHTHFRTHAYTHGHTFNTLTPTSSHTHKNDEPVHDE
jgi:hypothetical protein